jgi:hypothetical protein
MSTTAPALTFAAVDVSPSVRAERRHSEFLKKHHALDALLVGVGLMRSMGDDGTPAGKLSFDSYMAACAWVDVWKHRATRLDKTLRNILASDAISEEQRAAILRGLYGTPEAERVFLTNYRRLSDRTRASVRALVEELTAAPRPRDGA